LNICLLDACHNRTDFTCEVDSLTNYIRHQVGQDIKKKLAVCFVATDSHQNVIGYYTLSSESLGRDLVPKSYVKKLPKSYNAPVILLGRLARDISVKGTGLGELLLVDALLRSFAISEDSLGAMAVVTDPINQNAVSFYRRYGFIQLPDSGRMFLPMDVVRQLL